ncbi:MAG: hypothetical protein WAW96_07465 [Alphaproteobacteria bacterium]
MLNFVSDPGRLKAIGDRLTTLAAQHVGLLLKVALIGALFGVVYAHFVPANYPVQMTVTAARYTSDTKPVTAGSALSLLARADSGELSDFALYTEVLTSLSVSQKIFDDHPEIVLQLFRAEWRNGAWAPPHTMAQLIKNFVYGLVGASAWAPPDAWRLSQLLGGMVHIEKNGRNPIATISIRGRDRKFGIELLYVLHEEAESILKAEAYDRSENKAKFLLDMMEHTSALDLATQIGEVQLRNRMSAALSRSPVPFAAEFISPPDGPARASALPHLLAPIIVAIIFVLATLLALLANERAVLRATRWMATPDLAALKTRLRSRRS